MAGIVPKGPTGFVTRARLTRAAVFAGVAISACGGPSEETTNEGDETSGNEVTTVADPADATTGSASTDAGVGVANSPDASRDPDLGPDDSLEQYQNGGYRNHQCTPEGQCPPYGTPPHREDWV